MNHCEVIYKKTFSKKFLEIQSQFPSKIVQHIETGQLNYDTKKSTV